MEIKKELAVKLHWENNKGFYSDEIKNLPTVNWLKCDFKIIINAVANVDEDRYDLIKIDVEDLLVFDEKDNYVILNKDQQSKLINSIKRKSIW